MEYNSKGNIPIGLLDQEISDLIQGSVTRRDTVSLRAVHMGGNGTEYTQNFMGALLSDHSRKHAQKLDVGHGQTHPYNFT